jgi:hypothetical protein
MNLFFTKPKICFRTAQKKSAFEKSKAENFFSNLFHQQHLSSALDGAVQLTLIMRRQPRVFAWQNAALVGHELFEQIDVFKIEGVKCEIDFWLGTRRAIFHRALATLLFFIFVDFAWHKNYLISR